MTPNRTDGRGSRGTRLDHPNDGAPGLCVAYCEANDCETQPDETACLEILASFSTIADEDRIPCAPGGGGPQHERPHRFDPAPLS